MNTTDKAMVMRRALTRFIAEMREEGKDVAANDAMNLMRSVSATGQCAEVLAKLWNAIEHEKETV
jgi:hypothetical protein